MKKKLSLVLLYMLILCTTEVFGQYTVVSNQIPKANYMSDQYDFSLDEICNALDVDKETFLTDFNADSWGGNYITLASDNNSTNYTQGGHGGYWMTADGRAINWSESSDSECIFCVLAYADEEEDLFSFYFWQIPNKAKVGDKYHCVIDLNYNGKTLSFDITVNVVEKEFVDVETSLSKLNILGTIEAEVTQEPRDSWAYDIVTMDITDAITALGHDANNLKKNLWDYLYMSWYNKENEAREDVLRNTWTANSGFWTGTFYDESTGKESGELIENVDWKIYVEAFSLNPETGELSFHLGQQPNVIKHDVHYWLPMYLIKGSNAYILKVYFNSTEEDPSEQALDFADQENVGTLDIELDEFPNSTYRAWPVTINIDEIAELIGGNKSDIKLRAEESEGVISTNTTANNGGYWIDQDGYVITFGTGAFTSVEPSGDLSYLYVGQYPGSAEIGQVRKFTMYLVGKRAHYTLNFTVNIVEQQSIDLSDYELVSDEIYEFQMLTSDDWSDEHLDEGIDLGAEKLHELLGEGTYKFLGEEKVGDNIYISDNYTCDPKPAFWMEDGYIHAYGGNNCFAILYKSDTEKFQFLRIPSHNQIGDNYVAHFWLINEETKKIARYTIYVEYVEKVVNYENAGNETICLPLMSEEDEDYIETAVDMTACFEALGCSQDEFYENGGAWKSCNSDGRFSTEGYEDEMYGFWFDKDGNPTLDELLKVYSVEYLPSGVSDMGKDCFRSFAFEEGTYKAILCAEYEGKRYIFTIYLTKDPENFDPSTGINNFAIIKHYNNSLIYDLSGRRIVNPEKGIYIIDGKKIIIK